MGSQREKLATKAAAIVRAYVANHKLAQEDVPELLASVLHTLIVMSGGASNSPPAVERGLKPAVPVRKSIMPQYIICLEDGKRFKSLKRHLRAQHDLSVSQYRDRWGLPGNYPMVAPNYAKKRSQLAVRSGLGKKGR
jgi:predicted transcriptional regulator